MGRRGIRENLIGQRFGKLLVIGEAAQRYEGGRNRYYWHVKCDCGTLFEARGVSLKSGKPAQCFPCGRVATGEKNTTHGESKTKLYWVWASMRERCGDFKFTQLPTYKRTRKDKYYKDKGVSICKEWSESFETFRDWAYANGYREGLEIDRIDSNLGYFPENCRWVDDLIQNRHLTSNIIIEWDGHPGCVKEIWALSKSPVCYDTVLHRLEKKWTVEDALFKPPANQYAKKKKEEP